MSVATYTGDTALETLRNMRHGDRLALQTLAMLTHHAEDCCSLCFPPSRSASSSMDSARPLSSHLHHSGFDIVAVCRIEIRFEQPVRPD